MITVFSIYLIVFLFLLLILFSIGFLYFSLLNVSIFNVGQPFLNFIKIFSIGLVFGFVILTTFISCFLTGMNTIYSYVFFILLLPFIKDRKLNFKKYLLFLKPKYFIPLVGISILIFVYNFFNYYRQDGYVFLDLVYYGKTALGIVENKKELNYVFFSDFYSHPKQLLYHYGDLWITGVLAKLTELPSTYILVYVVYPILHLIAVLLTVGIFSNYKGNIAFKILLGVSILYGIKYFSNIELVENVHEVFQGAQKNRGFPYPIFCNKLLPIYVLFLLGYFFYSFNFIRISFIILSLIPIFYSTTIPVFAGISLFCLLISILKDRIKPKILKYWNLTILDSMILLLPVIFILILVSIIDFESFKMEYKIYTIKTYFILFIETFIKLFTEYLLVLLMILLIFFKYRFKLKLLFKPMIILPVIGLFSGFIFIYIHAPGYFDLDQSLYNISSVLILILSFELVKYLNSTYQKILIVFLVFFSLSNLSYKYFNQTRFSIYKSSYNLVDDFKNRANKYIYNYKEKIISCSIKTSEYTFNPSWKFDLYNKFEDLYISNKISIPLEIGFLIKPIQSMYVKDHPYFEFNPNKKVSIENIIRFIKQKKVNHLFIEDYRKIPKVILSNFEKVLYDKKDKLSIWKLKTN